MNISILLSAPTPIPAHALAAIAALLLGAIQFLSKKGTRFHRSLGYLWVGIMFITAATSFFIHEFRWIGPLGPIHLLSAFVLYSLWKGISAARNKNIHAHKRNMVQLYFFSLILAGGFTFLPGRLMHQVLFG